MNTHEAIEKLNNWPIKTDDAFYKAITHAIEVMKRSQWQDISTAPRDGSWVRLRGGAMQYCWEGDTDPPEVIGQWTTYQDGGQTEGNWQFAWYDAGFLGMYEDPTHWMPLPDAPEVK
jgi:hypothetical protein